MVKYAILMHGKVKISAKLYSDRMIKLYDKNSNEWLENSLKSLRTISDNFVRDEEAQDICALVEYIVNDDELALKIKGLKFWPSRVIYGD